MPGADVNNLMRKNIGAIAARRPSEGARGWIRNLDISPNSEFDDTLRLWFRPTTIQEALSVNYSDQGVIGMSAPYQNYEYTEGAIFTFDVFVNALMIIKEISADRNRTDRDYSSGEFFAEGGVHDLKTTAYMMEQDRRFLQALTVPRAGLENTTGGVAPPACILCVPNVCCLRVRVQSVNFQHNLFDVEGRITQWTASVEFKEAPLGRFTMEDVLENGANRTWGA